MDGTERAEPPSSRMLAMLRAVGDGRAEMSCGCEPDLYVDGLSCCDQATAHDLTHHGLITPQRQGQRGELVPAELTTAGRTLLELASVLSREFVV